MYWLLAIISLVCMSGDSDNFAVWLVWELIWFMVFMYSAYRMRNDED